MMTEPGVRFFVPQHWGAALVAIENFSAQVDQDLWNPFMLNGNSVLSLLERYFYPGDANFIAEIGEGNAPASELKKHQKFCLCETSTQPADDSCAVVIGEDEGGHQWIREVFFEGHQHLPVAFCPERG